jgi:hypothetical protein
MRRVDHVLVPGATVADVKCRRAAATRFVHMFRSTQTAWQPRLATLAAAPAFDLYASAPPATQSDSPPP